MFFELLNLFVDFYHNYKNSLPRKRNLELIKLYFL